MSDILERLKVWQSEKGYVRGHRTGELLLDAIAVIERLRAGGCARDQQTTQYCGEAARLAKENAELREAVRVLGTAIGAWVCSDDAYDACVSNPIARAAIDAAGGGEEAR